MKIAIPLEVSPTTQTLYTTVASDHRFRAEIQVGRLARASGRRPCVRIQQSQRTSLHTDYGGAECISPAFPCALSAEGPRSFHWHGAVPWPELKQLFDSLPRQ